MAATKRAFTRHYLHQARARVAISLAVGLGAAWATPSRLGGVLRAVAGWDGRARHGRALLDAHPSGQRRPDPPPRRRRGSRPTSRLGFADVADTFALGANAAILHNARACAGGVRDLYVGLCLGAVVTAWVLTHTAFTPYVTRTSIIATTATAKGVCRFPVRAARLSRVRLFAFTIGMCFQISDVTVTSRPIRRAVLGQRLCRSLQHHHAGDRGQPGGRVPGLTAPPDRRCIDDDFAGEVELDVVGVGFAPLVAGGAES